MNVKNSRFLPKYLYTYLARNTQILFFLNNFSGKIDYVLIFNMAKGRNFGKYG